MAIIKEKGTIAFMSEVQSGMSQSGNPWYRQTIVVDVAGYNGSYRKVALAASGNVVGDLEQMQVGDKVEFSYQVTSREYNGKWYTNADLFKVEAEQVNAPQVQTPAYPQYPQYPQQYVQSGMYQTPPAPAAPAPAAPRQRGRVQSVPQIPANTPMNLEDGDLPPSFM